MYDVNGCVNGRRDRADVGGGSAHVVYNRTVPDNQRLFCGPGYSYSGNDRNTSGGSEMLENIDLECIEDWHEPIILKLNIYYCNITNYSSVTCHRGTVSRVNHSSGSNAHYSKLLETRKIIKIYHKRLYPGLFVNKIKKNLAQKFDEKKISDVM